MMIYHNIVGVEVYLDDRFCTNFNRYNDNFYTDDSKLQPCRARTVTFFKWIGQKVKMILYSIHVLCPFL